MIVHGYTATGFISITLDGVDMTVPDDMANRHRQMIADWEAEGNVIPAYVPPPEPEAVKISPVDKLAKFLAENPDVKSALGLD